MVVTRAFASAGLACFLGVASGLAHAQDELDGKRGAVLRTMGRVESTDLPLFPVLPRTGLVFDQPLNTRGADTRLHFTIVRPDTVTGSWRIEIVRRGAGANAEPLWAFSAAELVGNGFWSDEIEGNLRIRVISDRPNNDLQLRIDKRWISDEGPRALSITEPNGLLPLAGQDQWIIDDAASVALLKFVASDANVYACTGFLLSSTLLLTNQHCIGNEEEAGSAIVDFDYDKPAADVVRVRLSEIVASSVDLDYSVVRLSRPMERAALTLDATPVTAGENLVVIEHPGGEPKQVSIDRCFVGETQAAGRTGTPTDFTHECDTMSSSSGSPVLSKDRRTVVGLHHLGFEDDATTLQNRAVHIEKVIKDLRP